MGNNKPSFLFRLFRAFTPPIIFQPLMAFFKKNTPILFDGGENSFLFKKYIQNCKVYGEYGCGLSTQYVLNKTNCSVISIDSSNEWVDFVKSKTNCPDRLNLHYIDVGKIGDWGRPIDYKKRDDFENYTNQLWEQNLKPDLVLIDGRFRVACFLTCLLKSPVGTVIIFDDYTNRPEYHLVEEFLEIKESSGRQAVFVSKFLNNTEKVEINEVLVKFRCVMD